MYGVQSTDEMGELWLQVLVANTNDQSILTADVQKAIFNESLQYNQYLLRLNPADARAHSELGKTLLLMGRRQEARAFLTRAIELDPDLDDPHYYLGLLFRLEGQLERARSEFEAAVRLNPDNAKAHGNLGLVWIQLGQPVRAKPHLETALRLNPEDNIARETLRQLTEALGSQRQ
jgi:tetratricopeptide (TPR) repeat protein